MISTDIARLDRSAAFAHKYVLGYIISLCLFICIFLLAYLAFGLARFRLVPYIISPCCEWLIVDKIIIAVGLLLGNVSPIYL